ncbi:MAG: PEP-CTERM sorting domain-containing protein [Pirellulaceae bacterium]|nr:PEP-CTERM sorting domain-containing protein [Pirellulaceae bacterium]
MKWSCRISLKWTVVPTTLLILMSFTVRAHASAYADAVLADGPIGYWNLDQEGGAGTVAPNLGTLGEDGNGEFFGDDIAGAAGPDLPGLPDNKAIRLDFGIDISGVEVVEPILDDLSAFTLEGWINPEEAELSNRAGLFGQDNAIEFGFIGPNDVHFWAELPDGGDVHINSLYEFDNEEWHHIALTSDGETGESYFYVDGEEQELQQDNTMPLEDLDKESFGISGNPFNIGGGPIFGGDTQFVGSIDEVSVFDKALTEEQVLAHYMAAIEGGGDPADRLDDGSLTDTTERVNYVHDVLGTWMGDANLDGEFNSSDLVQVFSFAKYESGDSAGWAEGDFSGDSFFNSSDLVAAFSDAGYEQGARGVAVVPEPTAGLLLIVGAVQLLLFRRRKSA